MTITWDNPDELEEYISCLQSAADRPTSENWRLRKCHGTLTDKVLIKLLIDVIVFFSLVGNPCKEPPYKLQ